MALQGQSVTFAQDNAAECNASIEIIDSMLLILTYNFYRDYSRYTGLTAHRGHNKVHHPRARLNLLECRACS
jgi:hypothetical protein